MSKDTSSLYTGMTSQESLRIREERKQAKKEKDHKATEVFPIADYVYSELAKERTAIGAEIANIIHMDMASEDVKATVLGLKMADERLQAFKIRLDNLLRGKHAPKL